MIDTELAALPDIQFRFATETERKVSSGGNLAFVVAMAASDSRYRCHTLRQCLRLGNDFPHNKNLLRHRALVDNWGIWSAIDMEDELPPPIPGQDGRKRTSS